MTPIDEAVDILRGLASQVKDVEPHCVELRTDPDEGPILSLEYLCGDLALWVQMRVEDQRQIDETGRAWVNVQLETIVLPQPLGVGRLVALAEQVQQLFPSLDPDISVRNRGDEECIVEGEWYGEIEPSNSDQTIMAAVASLLHELQAAAAGLERALLDAERMQQVEEQVAGLILGTEHPTPRKRPPGSGKRRWGQRR